MGRKKKKPLKPWCWYCNREFDDDKILVQHQRAKHFKCPFCHKKLYSGPGLTVHCIQVHKESIYKIPEALPNRNSVDIDIYGMQGIPEEDVREHERLKRGDDGPSTSQDNKPQQQSNPQASRSQPHPMMHNPAAMAAMQAAMQQHALGLGPMPPGFPPTMPPPGPHTSFMPPGFPPMSMHPNMPFIPPPGFAPNMMPPSSLAGHLQMGFPPPPPPPPPMLPTTRAVPPPIPPMSGVGRLIGVPPPNFQPPPPPAGNPSSRDTSTNSKNFLESSNGDRVRDRQTYTSSAPSSSSSSNQHESTSKAQAISNSSSITITKPASTFAAAVGKTSLEGDEFMEVPGSKSRIMHPNRDLSLEEMRLELRRYRSILEKLSPGAEFGHQRSEAVGGE